MAWFVLKRGCSDLESKRGRWALSCALKSPIELASSLDNGDAPVELHWKKKKLNKGTGDDKKVSWITYSVSRCKHVNVHVCIFSFSLIFFFLNGTLLTDAVFVFLAVFFFLRFLLIRLSNVCTTTGLRVASALILFLVSDRQVQRFHVRGGRRLATRRKRRLVTGYRRS